VTGRDATQLAEQANAALDHFAEEAVGWKERELVIDARADLDALLAVVAAADREKQTLREALEERSAEIQRMRRAWITQASCVPGCYVAHNGDVIVKERCDVHRGAVELNDYSAALSGSAADPEAGE
jgi:hypothetical protein